MPPIITPAMTRMRISTNRGKAADNAGCTESNGSNETTTTCRFATAKITRTIASGTRISAETVLRIIRSVLSLRYASSGTAVPGRPARASGKCARHGRERPSRGADLGGQSRLRRPVRAVEPLAHLFAGLEERDRLRVDRNMGAGARIASGAGGAVLHRKGAEAAQLDTVAARHGSDDLVENCVDDVLHVALVEMRILRSDALHKLGFDHRASHPCVDKPRLH